MAQRKSRQQGPAGHGGSEAGAQRTSEQSLANGAQPSEGPERSKPTGRGFAPGLYLTATPIGNLRDITLRALDLLAGADIIACEDTRTTARLLREYAITTPSTPYHEHNAARARPGLLRRLAAGQVVALVSDAGTPLVSDPGYKLVRAAIEAGHKVSALPGASAVLAALGVAGVASDRFLMAGFLPPRAAARMRALDELAAVPASLVIFEAARRLPGTLATIATRLGPREACVARELTKLFEEARRGTLDELAAHYADAGPPKGEVVIVVGPPGADVLEMDDAALDAALGEALTRYRLKDAVDAVAGASGRARRDVYQRALALDRRDPDEETS
jgi:16S rRNA (cytidine1402-2'-O)-methyltransferase